MSVACSIAIWRRLICFPFRLLMPIMKKWSSGSPGASCSAACQNSRLPIAILGFSLFHVFHRHFGSWYFCHSRLGTKTIPQGHSRVVPAIASPWYHKMALHSIAMRVHTHDSTEGHQPTCFRPPGASVRKGGPIPQRSTTAFRCSDPPAPAAKTPSRRWVYGTRARLLPLP